MSHAKITRGNSGNGIKSPARIQQHDLERSKGKAGVIHYLFLCVVEMSAMPFEWKKGEKLKVKERGVNVRLVSLVASSDFVYVNVACRKNWTQKGKNK